MKDFTEFLEEMENGSISLDEAIQDFGRLFEDTPLEQAYHDYMDARVAIKKTLRRFAEDNGMDSGFID